MSAEQRTDEQTVEQLKQAHTLIEAQRRPRPAHRAQLRAQLLNELDRDKRAAPLNFTGQRVVWALAALLLVGAGAYFASPRTPQEAQPAAGPQAPIAHAADKLGLTPQNTRCEADQAPSDDEVTLERGCAVAWSSASATIQAVDQALLSRERSDDAPLRPLLRLKRGEVRVEVERDLRRALPVTIKVSGGRIEVLGTAFTIEERGQAGSVTLHHGKIRFTHNNGQQQIMAPGQTLRWEQLTAQRPEAPAPKTDEQPAEIPSPTIAQPAEVDEQPAPSKPKLKPAPPEALAKIAQLRRAKDYDGALSGLLKLYKAPLEPKSAEIISYEIGDILTHQLKDNTRACAHWKKHIKRHASGPHLRAAKAAKAQTCP